MDFPKVLLPYGIVVSPLAVQLEGPGPDPWWVSPLRCCMVSLGIHGFFFRQSGFLPCFNSTFIG